MKTFWSINKLLTYQNVLKCKQTGESYQNVLKSKQNFFFKISFLQNHNSENLNFEIWKYLLAPCLCACAMPYASHFLELILQLILPIIGIDMWSECKMNMFDKYSIKPWLTLTYSIYQWPLCSLLSFLWIIYKKKIDHKRSFFIIFTLIL